MATEISEYEKFKLERLQKKHDDDNNSAHFSAHYSNSNETSRDLHMNSFRSQAAKETTGDNSEELIAKQK